MNRQKQKNKLIPAGDIPILKCADVQVTSTITSCTISDTTLGSDIGNFLPGTFPSDIIKAKLLEMSISLKITLFIRTAFTQKKVKKKNVFLNEHILNNLIGFIIQLQKEVYFVSTFVK